MSATILNFPRAAQGPAEPRLVAEFSTKATGPEGSRWTQLEVWLRPEGGLRCVKIRGMGDAVDSTTEHIVATLDEAKPWFGGGWVVNELFRIARGGYTKAPDFGRSAPGPRPA